MNMSDGYRLGQAVRACQCVKQGVVCAGGRGQEGADRLSPGNAFIVVAALQCSAWSSYFYPGGHAVDLLQLRAKINLCYLSELSLIFALTHVIYL